MSQIQVFTRLLKNNNILRPIDVIRRNRILFHSSQNALQQQKETRNYGSENASLQTSSGRTDISTDVRPLGEKIKENTKTASYTAIIIAGVSVTGLMFYAIFRELFSSSSPNSVYSKALSRVIEEPRVQDALGAPIKGYGEESRRGRRQHIAHTSYERNGVKHMRMKFYVQGIRNKATVHLEARKAPSGKMEYRFLFVQLDHYPHTTIILEDNRSNDPTNNSVVPLSLDSGVELKAFSSK